MTLASLEALWSRGYWVDAAVFVKGRADADGEGTGGGIPSGLRDDVSASIVS